MHYPSAGDTSVIKTDCPRIPSLQKVQICVQGKGKDEAREEREPYNQGLYGDQWATLAGSQARASQDSNHLWEHCVSSLRASENRISKPQLFTAVTEAQRRSSFVTIREQG